LPKQGFCDKTNVIFNPLIVGAQELNIEQDGLFFSSKPQRFTKKEIIATPCVPCGLKF
jgi:hypothetical protein